MKFIVKNSKKIITLARNLEKYFRGNQKIVDFWGVGGGVVLRRTSSNSLIFTLNMNWFFLHRYWKIFNAFQFMRWINVTTGEINFSSYESWILTIQLWYRCIYLYAKLYTTLLFIWNYLCRVEAISKYWYGRCDSLAACGGARGQVYGQFLLSNFESTLTSNCVTFTLITFSILL